MGHNRKDGKPPLYRKVNKRTHNGYWHYVSTPKLKYRYERGKKQDVLPRHSPIKRHNSSYQTGYDYTPLIKFLHAHVGQEWNAVYQECVSRLDSPKPLTWMVVNVNERGVVVDNYPGRDLPDYVCGSLGEESYWSALWVDADGLLQFVDKNDKWIDEFVKYMTDNYYGEMWTVSCNGKVVWPESAVKQDEE
ncbi:MAG: hypothetical protein IJK22_02215 [Bacteroidales bacterium]|nr:hypothetical protein [Bacteroidales bacterium]